MTLPHNAPDTPHPQHSRLGIDLGGSKIAALVLGPDEQVLWEQRLPTPQGDYAGTLAAIVGLVQGAEQALGQTLRVGIGTPGSISPKTGLMRNANSTCLNQRPLQQDLETALQRPLRLANDANCFALSEACDGAGQGAAVVFGVILGTGVGGGVVVNGQLLTGCNGIAGEWGHSPLPVFPGSGHAVADRAPLPCYCGRQGCIETWLSGPGLLADHQRSGGLATSVPALVTAALAGVSSAENSLHAYERRLAAALAVVINLLDPEVIVLGGGLSAIDRLYQQVPRLWDGLVFSDSIHTRLLRPRYGDASGVRGAARLWPRPVS